MPLDGDGFFKDSPLTSFGFPVELRSDYCWVPLLRLPLLAVAAAEAGSLASTTIEAPPYKFALVEKI